MNPTTGRTTQEQGAQLLQHQVMKYSIKQKQKHEMRWVRENEIEDGYICNCGVWVKVPKGCDKPDCPNAGRSE